MNIKKLIFLLIFGGFLGTTSNELFAAAPAPAPAPAPVDPIKASLDELRSSAAEAGYTSFSGSSATGDVFACLKLTPQSQQSLKILRNVEETFKRVETNFNAGKLNGIDQLDEALGIIAEVKTYLLDIDRVIRRQVNKTLLLAAFPSFENPEKEIALQRRLFSEYINVIRNLHFNLQANIERIKGIKQGQQKRAADEAAGATQWPGYFSGKVSAYSWGVTKDAAYKKLVSTWQAAGDGLAQSEFLQDEIGKAAQRVAVPLVEAAGEAARRAGEEVLETLRESVDEIDKATKKLVGLTDTLTTGINQVTNASAIGIAKGGAALLGTFAAGWGVYLAGREIRKKLDKPDIVKETNIPTVRQRFARLLSGETDRSGIYPLLAHVVLDEETFHRVDRIKIALQGTKKHGGFFTNCLLWGPPGTGKTLTAKALANEVNCYWMLLSGSSLMELTRAQALQEIDNIFEFASRQSKPVVIIIDEADPMLEKRSDNMDRDTLAVMSHFMQKTGTKRNDIMFIAITNRPAVFDEAILRRFPEQLEIKLPHAAERSAILRFNIVRHLQKQRIDTSVFTPELIAWIAAETEGLSGSEIEDFVLILYQEYYAALQRDKKAPLSEEMVRSILFERLQKKRVAQQGFKITNTENRVVAIAH